MHELILEKEKFDNDITNLINSSKLPAFILRQTIKEILEQLVILEQKQLEDEKLKKENEIDINVKGE